MRIHGGILEKEGIEIPPQDRFLQGIFEIKERTVGLPQLPTSLERLRYDVLISEKRKVSRIGIQLFGLEYNAPIISKILARTKEKDREFLIRYDPRDIREIYLYDKFMEKYHHIPLKNVYYEQLQIHNDGGIDTPLSLEELNSIKKNLEPRSKISHHMLVKGRQQRQVLVEKS
jgi:hypothetical protein